MVDGDMGIIYLFWKCLKPNSCLGAVKGSDCGGRRVYKKGLG